MARLFQQFSSDHITFIDAQKMFFIATAPLSEGNVNLSPKGYDTLKIINSKLVLYADYYGSGNQTATHINENQRVTLMWNSFDETPLILRAYGKGRVIAKETEEFDTMMNLYYKNFESKIIRQLFLIDIYEVQSSCGWGVPLMKFEKHRDTLEVMSHKTIK